MHGYVNMLPITCPICFRVAQFRIHLDVQYVVSGYHLLLLAAFYCAVTDPLLIYVVTFYMTRLRRGPFLRQGTSPWLLNT